MGMVNKPNTWLLAEIFNVAAKLVSLKMFVLRASGSLLYKAVLRIAQINLSYVCNKTAKLSFE